MEEVWLPVREFPEHYEVSNLGRVRRSANGRGSSAGKIVKPSIGTSGYLHVCLSVGDRKHTRTIHRLVAGAFHGPIPPKMTVNHKDGDRHNNAATNLEIVTMGENHAHAYRELGRAIAPLMKTRERPGSTGENNGHAKLTWEKVREIRQTYASGGVRMCDLSDKYGVGKTVIHSVIHQKTWRE